MSRTQICSLLVVFLAGLGGFGYMKYRSLPVVHLSNTAGAAESTSAPTQLSHPPIANISATDRPSSDNTQQVTVQDETRAHLATMAAEALNAATPEDRAAALQQLGSLQTPEVMYALGQGLTDREPRNRYVSIDSLRLIAANAGDADGAIREMLRQATDDRDPEVAAHARAALGEVTELTAAAE